MKSPMNKDGKKGDLLSRGVDYVKGEVKKAVKVGKKIGKTAAKKAKEISEDLKKRAT